MFAFIQDAEVGFWPLLCITNYNGIEVLNMEPYLAIVNRPNTFCFTMHMLDLPWSSHSSSGSPGSLSTEGYSWLERRALRKVLYTWSTGSQNHGPWMSQTQTQTHTHTHLNIQIPLEQKQYVHISEKTFYGYETYQPQSSPVSCPAHVICAGGQYGQAG